MSCCRLFHYLSIGNNSTFSEIIILEPCTYPILNSVKLELSSLTLTELEKENNLPKSLLEHVM